MMPVCLITAKVRGTSLIFGRCPRYQFCVKLSQIPVKNVNEVPAKKPARGTTQKVNRGTSQKKVQDTSQNQSEVPAKNMYLRYQPKNSSEVPA